VLEASNHRSVRQSSEKSFGVVFSIIFLMVALYPWTNSQDFLLWALILSGIFLVLAFTRPKTLAIPNKLWFKFGLLLGSVIAPIVMVLVYFTTVLPTGLIMRLLGKDLLEQKLDKDTKSYWIDRRDPVGSMKNQF